MSWFFLCFHICAECILIGVSRFTVARGVAPEHARRQSPSYEQVVAALESGEPITLEAMEEGYFVLRGRQLVATEDIATCTNRYTVHKIRKTKTGFDFIASYW